MILGGGSPHVGLVIVDVEFRRRIEISFGSLNWRFDTLITQSQRPPSLVVIQGRNFSFKNVPAPFFENQSKRYLRKLSQRLMQQ